jgi:hypothetical protein
MSMPETPMHENDGVVLGQDNVRFARQIRPMKPKPEAGVVEKFSNNNLGGGVFRFHPPHCVTTLFPTYLVGHAG